MATEEKQPEFTQDKCFLDCVQYVVMGSVNDQAVPEDKMLDAALAMHEVWAEYQFEIAWKNDTPGART